MGPGFLAGLQSLGLSTASTSAAGNGATFLGPGSGDWNVTIGGSGSGLPVQGGALVWLAIGAAAAVAVLMLRRR